MIIFWIDSLLSQIHCYVGLRSECLLFRHPLNLATDFR